MFPRPDLLDDKSPQGIEVFQLTTEEDVPASHIYMEAQIFAPDSRRFILHRSAHAHGGAQDDPEHQYLLCDLENDGKLIPLTEELGVTGPSVSPDGEFLYYFHNETELAGGRLTLKRVKLDGTERSTLAVVDSPLPGTDFRLSQIYPLSTISSDGKRLAISGFLGDGNTEGAPYGMIVFDVEKATAELVIHGPTWCNMHPQYCRSTDEDEKHNILIQENHGNEVNTKGKINKLTGGNGADIHVIRDDGTDFRNLPWGRDGNEICQGHQCWRGRSSWAITGTHKKDVGQAQLIESPLAPSDGHTGLNTSGGHRNDLSRNFEHPGFSHFATDIEGDHFISDCRPFDQGGRIFFAELGEPGAEPIEEFHYLLNPRSLCDKQAHIHPFLSPDGSKGFFNSDESSILQAYMITGLENLL